MFSSKIAGRLMLVFLGSVLTLCALILLLHQQPVGLAEGTSLYSPITEVQIQNLVMDKKGLSFKLLVPFPEVDSNGRVWVAGLADATMKPGHPPLPFFSRLIVLPPGTDPVISVANTRVSAIVVKELALTENAELAPYIELEGVTLSEVDLRRDLDPTGDQFVQDTRFQLSENYNVSPPMYFRDLRLVRLDLFPFRYDAFSHQLQFAAEMDVSITYSGAGMVRQKDFKPLSESMLRLPQNQILNMEQAGEWRSLPREAQENHAVKLPVGETVFKIEIDKDGIYEITAEQLAAVGMDTGAGGVNPHSFQMIYRGEPLAYEFIGNDDDSFDAGESIRFYGWAFDGSRLESQFFDENVFWLWANGEALNITSTPSYSATSVSEVPYSVTAEQDNRWFSTYTNQWSLFPNEPDAWYWSLFSTSYSPLSETFQIHLDFPTSDALSATLTAEFSSRGKVNHQVTLDMNGDESQDAAVWYGIQNVNVTRTIPAEILKHGANSVTLTLTSASNNCYLCIALNRITVDYHRALTVADDLIIFEDEGGEPRQFNVAGFSHSSLEDSLVWDISDRLRPRRLQTETLALSGNGTYTLSFGTESLTSTTFIATSVHSLLEPFSMTAYEPPDLDPPLGGADWVAIAYRDFMTETERLANHRGTSQFGGLSTHVVDIGDVVNQYGYGLPIPKAIQNYLRHGLESWERAPSYLLLVGDSTIDPRHNNLTWDDPQFIPTDLVFEDFWQGQIPTDHTYSLLVGDDLLPDLAVGRLPVQDESELGRSIDKIIRYEEFHLFASGWMESITFIADADDPNAGYFCTESQATGDRLPSTFNLAFLCLDNFGGDTDLLKSSIVNTINSSGTSILNYRGHGGVYFWGRNILSTIDLDLVENSTRPFFSISGDCLDAHFAFPFAPGLGEELLADVDSDGKASGAVGHWGSTGLGTSNNHSAIIEAFYDALFHDGQVTVGDATLVGKVDYGTNPFTDPTLLWSFTLLGDPGMQLFRPSLSIAQSVEPVVAFPGDTVTYTLQATNSGVYPSHVIISQTLPSGFQFVSVTASISTTYEVVGDTIIFDLQFGEEYKDKGIPRNGIALITVEVTVTDESASGESSAMAEIRGTGLEAFPGDEIALAEVLVLKPVAWLPYISR